jgi:hypothetical protein
MRRLSRGSCRRCSRIALAAVIADPRFYRMSREPDSCFDCFGIANGRQERSNHALSFAADPSRGFAD